MYSASYKQEPISSSTQQHKENITENRKTTGVTPGNAGARTGPMESWSSNHSSKGGGRTLRPLQTVIRGNALIKS